MAARARRAARTRDPEAKRAAVMDAARRLFSQRGFAATTTADVARAAGVSEGIVFHHFGSKAELLEAIAADYGRGLAQAMFQSVPARAGEVAAGPMLRAAFEYVRKHGALARLLKYTPDDKQKSAAKRATRAEIVGALARGLGAWSEAGLLRPMNAQIAAELLFALVEAALIECFVHNEGADEDAYLREAIACTEGALRLFSPPEPSTRRARK